MKTRKISTVILASCLVSAALTGQPAFAQSPLPPLAAPRPVVLPKVTQETLPNGLRLVVLEDHKQPAIWLQLAVPAGSVRDPKEKVGLAVMTANLLDKGTTTRSETQIADLTDGLGASLGASADDDYMTLSASGLSSYTDILFELLADITLRPTFPEAEVNRYRTRTLASVTAAMAEAGTVATAALNRLVFGDHPYGNYTTGTQKTLPGITPADLKQFHETYFAPNAATLFVVGDITPAQAREKALKVLGGWAKKDIPAAPVAPKPQAGVAGDGKPKIVIVDRPGAAQTEIRIGQVTPGYADPQRIPGVVAATLLGGGAFENRLMKEIRVKRGLSYGANSFISRNKDAGIFSITTFTKNASTGEVVSVALEEVKKLQETPPPAGELGERQSYITGTYSIGLATLTGVLGRLSTAILFGNGPEDLSLFTQRVQSVTPRDVQTVLQNLPLPANYVALVGDAKEIEPQVRNIGTVTVIPAAELDLLAANLRGSAAAAAGTPPGPSDDAAKALLAATIKAHGGDSLLAVKSLAFKGKGKLTTPPAQGSLEIPIDSATFVTALPGRLRFDLKTGFGDITLGSPGGGRPTWVIFSGQTQEIANQGESLDPVVLLVKTAKENLTVNILTESLTTADGKKLKGFQITSATGQKSKIFVEEDTYLVRRVEMIGPMATAVYELSGYKGATNGLTLPYTLKQSVSGQELFNLTFDSFEVNPAISDTMFDKPK